MKKISDDIEKEVISLYLTGKHPSAIGRSLGISRETVKNILIRNNIKLRPRSQSTSGIESHTFKGGNQRYWNIQCKIRDDYTCQICGFREPEIMVADHILPKSMYPELKFKLNNLVTLCPNCHARKIQREKKTHNYKEN
jgi:5-methylcytosine-specific restriction endonuclease McrA